MARFRLQAGSVMASPNIIPMADIMLVLLIIFTVVTPLFKPGAPVDMARVKDPIEMPDANRDDAVIVAIARDGSTFLGNTKMPLDEISSRARDRMSGRLDKTVFIKSDARTKYSDLVKVVDRVRTAGVDEVGLLTERSDANRRAPPRPLTE
jgi:biopolymer transport protein ExbD